MQTFIVLISCMTGVVSASCPLAQPMQHEFYAKSTIECYEQVNKVLTQYHYSSTNFNISCKLKR